MTARKPRTSRTPAARKPGGTAETELPEVAAHVSVSEQALREIPADALAVADAAIKARSQLEPVGSQRTVAGRPACRVLDPFGRPCERPEFMDDNGMCGAHWALRPDLRKEARRG